MNGAEQETALHSETDGTNYATDATYAPQGALATMTQRNIVVRSETYDSRLRPSTITAAVNGADILNLAYTYDPDSNVTQLAQTNVTNDNYTQTFTYDPLNRILSGSSTGASSWAQNFGYNGDGSGGRYGNVRCTSANGPPCAVLQFNPQNNRISLIGNQTPTYDAAGEMTSDGTGTGSTQYTWNAEGRMATVTPNGGATATYVYDGDGHRVEDTLPQRLYWYGVDGKLLGETDGGSVNIQWIYFDGRRISKFNMAPTGPWGADFYDDAIGSLRLETDGYGNPNCRSDYYPFGEPVGSGCSLYESFQYAGLYTDAGQEDGGYSATRRRYSNIYYRWFSPDPGGLAGAVESNPQTWNEYAYVLNNPLRYTDTLGGTPQDRVNAAYKLVIARIPYVYGGKNASPCVGGLDCSGFAEAVFQTDPDNRIKALDTMQSAASQWKDLLAGGQTSTNLSQARQGDAIFFRNTTTGKISHVGIVVATSKSYISFADEANSIAGARIEIMNRAHTQWGTSETFAGVGRPIEPITGENRTAQQQQSASSSWMGGLANWLEELFFNTAGELTPSVHSFMCGGSGESPCTF